MNAPSPMLVTLLGIARSAKVVQEENASLPIATTPEPIVTLLRLVQELKALVKKPTIAPIPPNWKTEGYLDRLPLDPWGKPYQYLQPGLHGDIDIMSFGADGVAGGTGGDADIGSWEL